MGTASLSRLVLGCPDTVHYRGRGRQGLRMVRTLPQALRGKRQAALRFLEMGRILRGIHHPNVCRVLQAELNRDGEVWTLGEWYEGQSLESLMNARSASALPWGRVLMIADQMLGAVGALHDAGIAHGRLSPHAFLWSRSMEGGDDWVRLLDMGRGWSLQGNDPQAPELYLSSKWSAAMPWEMFQAPEMLASGGVSVQGDVYAIAVCLYWLLTGGMPYRVSDGHSFLDVARKGGLVARVPTASRRTSLDKRGDLCAVLDRALGHSKQDRYPSADSLRQALTGFLTPPRSKPALPRPSHASGVRKARRSPSTNSRSKSVVLRSGGNRIIERRTPAAARKSKPTTTHSRGRTRPRQTPAQSRHELSGRCSRLLQSLSDTRSSQTRALPRPRTLQVLLSILEDADPGERVEESWAEEHLLPAYEPPSLTDDEVMFGDTSLDDVFSHEDARKYPALALSEPDDLLESMSPLSIEPPARNALCMAVCISSPRLRQSAGTDTVAEQIELRRALGPLLRSATNTSEIDLNTRRGLWTLMICSEEGGLVLRQLVVSLLDMGRSVAFPPAIAISMRWKDTSHGASLPEHLRQKLVEEAEDVVSKTYDGELMAPQEAVMLSGGTDFFTALSGSRSQRVPSHFMVWRFSV